MPGPPDLRGKGAIVTGGGSGICLAFTKELYQRGCNVLICDLGLHREAQTWLETLTTNNDNNDKNNGDEPPLPPPPPRVVFNKTDVSDWKQLEAAFDVYEKEFGGVPYVLCPGAGVYEPVRFSLYPFFFSCFSLQVLSTSRPGYYWSVVTGWTIPIPPGK
jgi:NAD(P)-dependent dehydrogenase (short-subunit alcohol dehydrogenase family)